MVFFTSPKRYALADGIDIYWHLAIVKFNHIKQVQTVQ